jgi:hypothetical protein
MIAAPDFTFCYTLVASSPYVAEVLAEITALVLECHVCASYNLFRVLVDCDVCIYLIRKATTWNT